MAGGTRDDELFPEPTDADYEASGGAPLWPFVAFTILTFVGVVWLLVMAL